MEVPVRFGDDTRRLGLLLRFLAGSPFDWRYFSPRRRMVMPTYTHDGLPGDARLTATAVGKSQIPKDVRRRRDLALAWVPRGVAQHAHGADTDVHGLVAVPVEPQTHGRLLEFGGEVGGVGAFQRCVGGVHGVHGRTGREVVRHDDDPLLELWQRPT